MTSDAFDAEAKEAALRAESERWDTSSPTDAEPGDIPVIDISEYLSTKSAESLAAAANDLRHACETVGFWQLVGHGIQPDEIAAAFEAVAAFHALPLEVKETILMDRADWPLGGVGYLPVGNKKLPARTTGNQNEAFILKGDRDIASADNQWLTDEQLPRFRAAVEAFSTRLEQLALDLLPVYATALGLEPEWFRKGFEHPFWRLRLTRYPKSPSRFPDEIRDSEHGRSASSAPPRAIFGINPHVDTTFFTLLLQDSPGLTIYHTPKDRWINVPMVDNAFVVNSGELLRQWTNDRFLSVRHFVGDTSGAERDRYSIPFFVNATRDYVMEPIPTCSGPDNPLRYAPISYNQSQGVVQGE